MSFPEVRAAQAADLPQLTEIYNHYVSQTPITFDIEPFSVETRRGWFEQFGAAGRYRLVVATEAGRVVGYAGSMRFRAKPAYLGSVETSVYLRPDAQGRGLGSRLYDALFEALDGEPVHRAYAGVTLPNPASIALHRRFGFTELGTYREVGHKFGRYWDVTWLEKGLV